MRNPLPQLAYFDRFRPTVVGLLVTPYDQIILVLPEPANLGAYILPQGEIRKGEPPANALEREMPLELPGIELKFGSILPLFDCTNEMPVEHSARPDKWMIFLSALILEMPRGIDGIRNINYCLVRGEDELLPAIAATRPRKRRMIIEAVNMAYRRKLLSWSARVPKNEPFAMPARESASLMA